MILEKIIIGIIPIPIFYLIYFRYFNFRPEFIKHAESFISGMALGLLLLIISSTIHSYLMFDNPFAIGFIKAALIEKTGTLLFLLLLYKYYPNFSIMEAIISAMLFGMGFSSVENIFYATSYGYSISLVRFLFSVPMHLITCGLMGNYLGKRRFSQTTFSRNIYLLKSLLIPITFHGLFDSILLIGGYISYVTAPILILMVILLDVMLAQSQNILPIEILTAMKIRFEDWTTIQRQPRYERWILQSMGRPTNTPVLLFLWRPGLIRFLLVMIFMTLAIVGLSFRNNIMALLELKLRNVDEVIILGIFPLSISLILIIVGTINPEFFKKSELKIPVISDVTVLNSQGMDDTFVTYDITYSNCFLRTFESLGIGTKLQMIFECPHFSSEIVKGTVIWENHLNKEDPTGSIIELQHSNNSFLLFILRYSCFRFTKGLIFNLKLPGFESIRRLFMRPISTMQDKRILKEGEVIFREGESGKEFYLLEKGTVTFYRKKKSGGIVTVNSITDGHIFGERALISNNPHTATAICMTDCILAVADRENLFALFKHNTDFSLMLIEALAKRSQDSEQKLLQNISKIENQKEIVENLFHTTILVMRVALHFCQKNTPDDQETIEQYIEQMSKHTNNKIIIELQQILSIKQKGISGNERELEQQFSSIIANLYEMYTENIV